MVTILFQCVIHGCDQYIILHTGIIDKSHVTLPLAVGLGLPCDRWSQGRNGAIPCLETIASTVRPTKIGKTCLILINCAEVHHWSSYEFILCYYQWNLNNIAFKFTINNMPPIWLLSLNLICTRYLVHLSIHWTGLWGRYTELIIFKLC